MTRSLHPLHVSPRPSLSRPSCHVPLIACPPCHVPFLVTLPDPHPRRFLLHLSSCFSSRPHLLHHRHFACHVPCHLYDVAFSPCQLRFSLRPRHLTSPVLSNPLHPHTRTAPCLTSRPTCRVSSSRPLRSYHHVSTSLSLLSSPSACSSFPFLITRSSHPLVTSPYSPAAQAWALRRGLPEVLRGDAAQVPFSRPLFKSSRPLGGDAAQVPRGLRRAGGRGGCCGPGPRPRGGETLRRRRGGQVAVGDDGAVQFNRSGRAERCPDVPSPHRRRHSA